MNALKIDIKGDIPKSWIEHFRSLSNNEERIAMTRKIAGVLMEDAEDALAQETSPEGKKWADLNENYKTYRHQKGYTGKILQKTGMMALSLNTHYTSEQAKIAASSQYAKFHQLGTKRMPARPFLGLSEIGKEEINDIFKRHFLK